MKVETTKEIGPRAKNSSKTMILSILPEEPNDTMQLIRVNNEVLVQLGKLSQSPYRSIQTILRDLALWLFASGIAEFSKLPLITALAIIFIGSGPMHDFLAQAHEGIHGMICRKRWLNEFFSWLVHAAAGLSATAYRGFHMEHHRKAHSDLDPELELLKIIDPKMRGWAYLLMPAAALIGINTYPLRHKTAHANAFTVSIDLGCALILHFSLFAILGERIYLTYIFAPLVLVLPVVSSIRSICEHHNVYGAANWRNTRGMKTNRVVEWLWSNVNYHLEHHLFPLIPFHKLPEARNLLANEYTRRNSVRSEGYLRTAVKLFQDDAQIQAASPKCPERVKTKILPPAEFLVNNQTFAFKMKVIWFEDILKCKKAKQYLWSLYYAGEAYIELHPDGVYMPNLRSPYNRLLARHLNDETRHAALFKELLEADQFELLAAKNSEDLGWFLLNKMVPDIVAKGKTKEPFSTAETARYMAFLHTLELRSVSDLYALLCAARKLGEQKLVNSLESILPDEVFHSAYTHKAVLDLSPDLSSALKLLDKMRHEEQHLYKVATRNMIGKLLQRGAMPLSAAGMSRWLLTFLAIHVFNPFPILPLYKQVPHKAAEGEFLRRFVPGYPQRTIKQT